MWVMPLTKKQEEDQARQHAEDFARRQAEWQKRHDEKTAWLKAHTCEHCKQHPPMPPWFAGY
jgi:hypothetical protein